MRTRLVSLLCTLWLATPLWLTCVLAHAEHEGAQIFVVDAARELPELTAVIAELLRRDGVEPEFVASDTFEVDRLLAEPDADGRVHVYVSVPTSELAKLYLRGPRGRRFLLRELPLRAGLDELGCESIAQVVASATQALLHSGVGLDREAARASLAREQAPAPPAPPPAAPAENTPPAPPPAQRVITFELSARGSVAYSGAALRARLGGGAEFGLSQHLRPLIVRERLVFEQYAAQSLDSAVLNATVRYSALRLGLDLGGARGPHALFGGLGAGVDLVAVDPRRARDATWNLSKRHLDALPMLRAELRYERSFAQLLLSVGAYADFVLGDNHFKLEDGARERSVAHPWHVLPGLALGLGWRSK